MKSLELRDVVATFGKVRALRGVSIEVEAGESLMLVGPNGAGKSTLMRVLLGLVRPTSATLRVDGKTQSVDNAFKSSLGYLPEAVAFSDNLTGRQVLSFFARARAVPRKRIDAVLERVSLTHASRRPVRGYSRGMKQRLGLGVAILAEPRLLVLDEPTGGLDQEGLSVLFSVLEEWRQESRLVLVATHDLALLERRVDRMCVLKAGQVAAVDTPAALRLSVDLPHRVRLTLANGIDHGLSEAIETWGRGVLTREAHELLIDVAGDDLLELMDIRGRFPAAVSALRVEEPGMDQVYEELLQVTP